MLLGFAIKRWNKRVISGMDSGGPQYSDETTEGKMGKNLRKRILGRREDKANYVRQLETAIQLATP